MRQENQAIFHEKNEVKTSQSVVSCGFSAVFDTQKSAIAAVEGIESTGFDMSRLSIVEQNYHTENTAIGFYSASDRVKYWGKLGAFWGAIFGLLSGPSLFIFPGIGPLFVADHFISVLGEIIEDALLGGGTGVLGAELFSIGIPHNSVMEYETAVRAGKYLMLVHSNHDDLKRAREIANNTGRNTIFEFDSMNKPVLKNLGFLN